MSPQLPHSARCLQQRQTQCSGSQVHGQYASRSQCVRRVSDEWTAPCWADESYVSDRKTQGKGFVSQDRQEQATRNLKCPTDRASQDASPRHAFPRNSRHGSWTFCTMDVLLQGPLGGLLYAAYAMCQTGSSCRNVQSALLLWDLWEQCKLPMLPILS